MPHNPEILPQLIQNAQLALRQNRPRDAESLCRHILSLHPNHPRALQGLGIAQLQSNRIPESIDSLAAAAALLPDAPEIHAGLAHAFLRARRLPDAIAAFRSALALSPNTLEWHNDLGLACEIAGQLPDAIAAFQSCLQLQPNFAPAHNNLGNVHKTLGQFSAAADAFQRAIAAAPELTAPRLNRAGLLLSMGRIAEAQSEYQAALALDPANLPARSNFLLSLQSTALNPQDTFQAHQQWAQNLPPITPLTHPHPPAADRDKRLRIGYISADFRTHSVAYFLEPLLENHNHSAFEIFCYADLLIEDETTRRLQKLADHWRPINSLTAEALARLIHHDRIDILIDLQGHTAGNRLLAFAFKPAPIQISYLGYPDTTGLAAIDFRLTDHFADPPEISDPFHTEKLLRLPHTFLCYRPPQSAPPILPRPQQRPPDPHLHLLQCPAKIPPDHTLPLWSQILHHLPHAHLLIKTLGLQDTPTRDLLLQRFSAHNIPPDRLTLLPQTPSLADHLNAYNHADIALDTFPYHGTTTTCEALWMGLPVITLAGHRHSSRVGITLLQNAGLPDLITDTPESYIKKALNLAHDNARRQFLRQTLRNQLTQSPLLNAPLFTQTLETTYRTLWQSICTPPAAKNAPPRNP